MNDATIYSKKAATKRIVKWALLVAVLVGTNYGTVRLVTLLDERDDLRDTLQLCESEATEILLHNINLENEELRPKSEELLN